MRIEMHTGEVITHIDLDPIFIRSNRDTISKITADDYVLEECVDLANLKVEVALSILNEDCDDEDSENWS